jgi:glucose-6-phosphate 1-epimerase
MPAVRWRSRDGASATATLQGAHLVSWVPAGGGEALFVSERSAFEAGKAIRGGVPVCFPQFAERGPLVKHGFARISPWRFEGASETEEGTCATFALESSPSTLAPWPHAFRLVLAATVGGPRLALELRVENPGGAAFEFAAALHTYFRVSDNAAARLAGLCGVVTAAEPIDRIYFAPPAATRLEDADRAFEISQHGFADTVVWNPGPELTAKMADMAPDGYRRMLCVEAAAIEPVVRVDAGSAWTGGQAIRAVPA